MIMLLLNLLLTIIITGMIGWTVRTRQFPFNGFKPQGGIFGWINCVFIIYNIFAIVSTWLSLGPISVLGFVYALIILVSFMLGFDYPAVQAFWYEIKTYGLLTAIKNVYYNWRLKMNAKKNNRRNKTDKA